MPLMSIPGTAYPPTQPSSLIYKPDAKAAPSSSPAGMFTTSYSIKAPETNRESQSISYSSLPTGAALPMIRTNLGAGARHQQLLSQTAFSPEATGGPQPGVKMPHEQLYFNALFPPQPVVAPHRPATIRPHPSDIQTDSAATTYTAGSISEDSRSPIMPARPLPIDNQQRDLPFQRTASSRAMTTQLEQRQSRTPSGYFGAPEPHDDTPYDLRYLNSQPTGSYTGSPTRAQNRESMYFSSPLNPAQQESYLTPQPQIASQLSPSPYMDEQVPALTTQPKFEWRENACIVTRDPLLNNNGDALYRFILDHMDFPSVQLHCFGSHTVSELDADGRMKTKKVVDFNFVIDLELSMKLGPAKLYTCGEDVMAYRGRMDKERGATRLRARTVRDWVRSYTASTRTGKEFRFNKVISGIDMPKICHAVDQIIRSTGYSSFRKVYFTVGNNSIKVQADSTLMMILTGGFVNYKLWNSLVFPFAWIYRRCGHQGGKWDVCRASFSCTRDPRDSPNVTGVPLGDGDWLKIWERTICLGVRNHIQTPRPIYRPTVNDSDVIIFD